MQWPEPLHQQWMTFEDNLNSHMCVLHVRLNHSVVYYIHIQYLHLHLAKKSIPCNIFQRTFLFNYQCDYVSWQSLTTCTLQMHSPPVCPWHWGTPEALPLVALSVGEEGLTHGLDVTSGSPWSWWFCCCVILLLTCLRTASERSARCKQKHMCERQRISTLG